MPNASRLEKPRACANCSRAKAKCVWPSTSDDTGVQNCQRCSKNNLTCSVSHPGVTKKRGKATHAKILEQKLDDIMSLLTRDHEQTAYVKRSVEYRPLLSSSFTPATTAPSPEIDHPGPPLQPTLASGQPRSGPITITPGFQISLEEADQVIQEYMAEMVPQFPFVPLRTYNAKDMYKSKPLLLKTILWACRPQGPDFATAFEHWFRQHIAHQIVVLVDKSLEVLQALLVFFAWNDIHFYSKARDTSLLQLAVGLVGDLGLTKSPDISDPTSKSIVEDAADLRNDVQARLPHTSDDRRAVLGIFYITSTLSSLLDKPSQLEYSSYFDHCCRQLLEDSEYPTDSLLVNLIGIQQISLKVNDTFWQKNDQIGDIPLRNIHSLAVATIEKDLATFMDRLPENIKPNHLLRSHYGAIRIRLFEPIVHNYRSDKLESPHLRSQIIWDCLRGTQVLCDSFLSMPITTYPLLSFIPMLHLALAVVKAARLLCTEDRDWDLGLARASFNFQDLLQQLTEHFNAASCVRSSRCTILLDGRPLFSEYAERFKWIQGWYLSKLGPGITHSASTSMQPASTQSVEQQGDFEFWQQLSELTHGLDS